MVFSQTGIDFSLVDSFFIQVGAPASDSALEGPEPTLYEGRIRVYDAYRRLLWGFHPDGRLDSLIYQAPGKHIGPLRGLGILLFGRRNPKFVPHNRQGGPIDLATADVLDNGLQLIFDAKGRYRRFAIPDFRKKWQGRKLYAMWLNDEHTARAIPGTNTLVLPYTSRRLDKQMPTHDTAVVFALAQYEVRTPRKRGGQLRRGPAQAWTVQLHGAPDNYEYEVVTWRYCAGPQPGSFYVCHGQQDQIMQVDYRGDREADFGESWKVDAALPLRDRPGQWSQRQLKKEPEVRYEMAVAVFRQYHEQNAWTALYCDTTEGLLLRSYRVGAPDTTAGLPRDDRYFWLEEGIRNLRRRMQVYDIEDGHRLLGEVELPRRSRLLGILDGHLLLAGDFDKPKHRMVMYRYRLRRNP